MEKPYTTPEDILTYYLQGTEQTRLSSGAGLLEYLRTRELLARYLPQSPAVILDAGGGAGVYALPLATQGYELHLIDPVPLHIEQATKASQEQTVLLSSIEVGDARRLRWPEASFDAVLLLGPLYHLPEREDRLTALREAHRVLRPDGVIFAAAISRFTSTLEALRWDLLSQPDFKKRVDRALSQGQRQDPTAYTHLPEELCQEIAEVGFSLEALVAVEGPGWLVPNLDEQLADHSGRDNLLSLLRIIESESSLIGVSPHIMGIGRKRG
jgi:ubiquinone/menaquinone biosynthesis C-methylase UbiE